MKSYWRLAATAVCSLGLAGIAQAKVDIPNVVRIIVPFSPGASNDTFGRAIAKKLTEATGKSFIVENKPGAGGTIGTNEVAKSKGDGATLLFSSSSVVTNTVGRKLSYNLLKDLAPISVVSTGPMVLVASKASGLKTLDDLKQALHSGKHMTYGTPGLGSIAHLASELLMARSGGKFQNVPYKGVSNAVVDMVGGRVDFMISTPASILGQMKSGDLVTLGVTSAQPSPFLPNVKPVADIYPRYTVDVWWAFFAPSGTPKELLDFYNKCINQAISSKDMADMFARESTQAMHMSTAESRKFIDADYKKWHDLAKARHIKLD
ncbi:tripartite tricarboxylate transporter substrate binding protein [Candidimonas humi]|uniref:Bug family tripartite tricarboxylate transporter substrate binding protein n=1 Tax=Candidimonas humi TaxID=683355 RepID=A0ABV8P098_9BURK|nr:tripartite tricarboxylate transporter substrate binding protein [Candidimonas humi]MBV6305702.1 tripartite tricarboxylate transporter substrate binding protein [Candidimonas humi]